MRIARPRAAATLALVLSVASGSCSLGINTLGGREKCWPASDQRAASVWRGTLGVSGTTGSLATPEGDVIPLIGGALTFAMDTAGRGVLVRGNDIQARDGDDVTLFGGAGADGTLMVCGVEENRGH